MSAFERQTCVLVHTASASLVPQRAKRPRVTRETRARFLGREDALEEGRAIHSSILGAPLVAQMVKRLPAEWETWVRSRGREDPLEKGTGTHSSTLAWKIP